MTTREMRILGWRLVLLPALLLAMALWQGQRADQHRTELLQMQGDLQGFISEMHRLQGENARQTIEIDGRPHSPALAGTLAERRLDDVQHELTFARIGAWLPEFSLPFSVLLLLLGSSALAALHWAGEAALASRDRLVRLFHIARQVMPVVLAALMLLLTLTAVLEIGYEALWLFALKSTSAGVIKLQLLVGLLMLAMLWPLYRLPGQLKAMLQLFRTEPHDIFGSALGEHQAPALWARVRELAQRLGALAPDNIVVGFLDGFYVTSGEVQLYPGKERLQGRTLYVPLTLLAALSREESDAVMAHELAHFSGQDTDYSIRFLPIYQGVWRSIGVLGEHMEGGLLRGLLTLPAYGLSFYAMQRFDHAVSHWSRSRELLADAAGARMAGPQAVVDSLVRIGALDALIVEYQNALCEQPAQWPDDLLGATLQHLAAQPVALADGELNEGLAHPTDSHPPTLQRIQALGMSAAHATGGNALRPVIVAEALRRVGSEVPEVEALSRQLSGALRDRLVEHRDEMRQELQARVEAVAGECVIHEGAHWRGRLLVAFGFAMLGVALWLRFGLPAANPKPGLLTFLSILALCVAGFGVWAGLFGWRMVKRSATPALVLTPETVRFHNAREAIELHHFDQFMIKVSPGVAVVLQLAEDAPLPAFAKRRFWEADAKFDAKSRCVTLGLARWSVDGKELKAKALHELVDRYLAAAHARRALQEL